MSIAWGTLGIEWNKPIFVAYVRKSRYTRQLLTENPEFTVNIPCGEFDSNILTYCGRNSGRDLDKIRDLVLTLVPSSCVSVPGIRELPLTQECKVVCHQEQALTALPESVLVRFYREVKGTGGKDHHIAFYGDVINAYIAE